MSEEENYQAQLEVGGRDAAVVVANALEWAAADLAHDSFFELTQAGVAPAVLEEARSALRDASAKLLDAPACNKTEDS